MKESIKVEFVDITPKLAAEWLQKNTRNRKLKLRVVKRYANEMQMGRWILTHQGIAFGDDGSLIDGQHRLAAIVQSECTIRMLVTWNLSKKAQLASDDGAKRSPFDAMSVHGVDGASDGSLKNEHTSIASVMARQGHNNYYKENVASKQVLLEYLETHWNAIEFAASLLTHGKRKGITQASVLAVIARAWYTQDKSRLKQFMEILYTGEMSSPDDVAAVTIRTWLITRDGTGLGGRHQKEIYSKVQRCLKAFLDFEQLRKCMSATKEFFPIPGEEKSTE